ncbi:hypothetical protein OH76DRAFT_343118 [Lentinus brumalis]|uniref:Uncharacterized protein n=1 Tax=Lentinus brumalis TaxID=2498619 RepID=A0A371DEV8_9APHY|nr:hypothetical protein OH76DRAFT_343118 [Polyporus brumalis]
MKVKADTVRAAAHFLLFVQLYAGSVMMQHFYRLRSGTYLRGFSGSSGPSQSTTITLSSWASWPFGITFSGTLPPVLSSFSAFTVPGVLERESGWSLSGGRGTSLPTEACSAVGFSLSASREAITSDENALRFCPGSHYIGRTWELDLSVCA